MAIELTYRINQYFGGKPQSTQVWKSLRYLNFYRVILAALFVIPVLAEQKMYGLGEHNLKLFTLVSYSYLLVAVFASFAIHWKKPSFKALLFGLTFLDIGVLTVLMHASGGVQSGIGLLIVIAIAGNSLLISGRIAGFFASLAAVFILGEQVYSHLEGIEAPNYTHAGILGLTLFATATLSQVLSKRLRETEALAAQRGIDLANLAQLNEHVIKRMQSGIIVVDAYNHIRLMNESAWHMLGLPAIKNPGNQTLAAISPELDNQLSNWKKNELTDAKVFHPPKASVDLLPHFTRLGTDKYSGTLIFLEDTARMAQQAQQMKLASLGRLTAGIAHEIRNPLGAISHAEQLLAEAEDLDNTQKRLTEIIHTNTERVNEIIENVLRLSRRGNTTPENLNLKQWLESFVAEYVMSQNMSTNEITINIDPETTQVNVDTTQFHQVLWNLCQNGMRYSADYPNSPKIELVGGISNETGRAFLDVIDHGSGIDAETAQSIFEPFFTTDAKGSGLGLYISKELCETNNAHIAYVPVPTGGSCFRIEFAKNTIS